MRSVGYRPDIDGLRTIAVVPVVLFHAGLRGFAGGYVGVDIFFVISGYLISGILLSDLEHGRYRISLFYQRRIRRIFPALAVMVAACLAAGFRFFTPDEYTNLGKSAIAVAAFCSNFYFWRSVNYFDNAQAVQPLLHTWSLAVEEQFYIFFPPLLAWLTRRRVRVLPVLAVLAALSFALAAAVVFRKPSAAFYLPFTRAWELLAGAMLSAGAPPPGSARMRAWAGPIGLLLTLVPVGLYDSHTVFPGLTALPPVAGATLLIWSNAVGSTPVGRLLSTAPMTFIGRISYSLYLWHVPVFAIAVYLHGGALSLPAAMFAIAVAVVLAWVSYRFVETPFRAGSAKLARRPIMAAVSAMAAMLIVAVAVVAGQGWPARLDARGRALVEAADDQRRFHIECMTIGDVIVPPARACRLGAQGSAPVALLWGDSHAMVTATAMEIAARRHGRAFMFAASVDCPIGLGFSIDEGTASGLTTTPGYRYCATYNREMLRLALATRSIRLVVLSSRWSNWRLGEPANRAETEIDIRLRDQHGVAGSRAANGAVFKRGFDALIEQLHSAGKQVVIVGPLPEPNFNVPQRLFVEQFGWTDVAAPIGMDAYRRRHHHILAIFAPFRRQANTRFIWPAAELCSHDMCPIEDHGHAMFFDHDHLSFYASRRTARLYDSLFQ